MKITTLLLFLTLGFTQLFASTPQAKITFSNNKTETVTFVAFSNNTFYFITQKEVYKAVELDKVESITTIDDFEDDNDYQYELENEDGDFYDCHFIEFKNNTFTVISAEGEHKFKTGEIELIEIIDRHDLTEDLVLNTKSLKDYNKVFGIHFEFGNAKSKEAYNTDIMKVGFRRIGIHYMVGSARFLWGFKFSFVQGKNNIGNYYPRGNNDDFSIFVGKRKVQSLEIGVPIRFNVLEKAITPYISFTPSFSYSSDPLQHYRNVYVDYNTNTPVYDADVEYYPVEHRVGSSLNTQIGLSYLLDSKFLFDAALGYQSFLWQRGYQTKFRGFSFGIGASYVF